MTNKRIWTIIFFLLDEEKYFALRSFTRLLNKFLVSQTIQCENFINLNLLTCSWKIKKSALRAP